MFALTFVFLYSSALHRNRQNRRMFNLRELVLGCIKISQRYAQQSCTVKTNFSHGRLILHSFQILRKCSNAISRSLQFVACFKIRRKLCRFSLGFHRNPRMNEFNQILLHLSRKFAESLQKICKCRSPFSENLQESSSRTQSLNDIGCLKRGECHRRG